MDSPRRIIISILIVVCGWIFVSPWVIADAGAAPASWGFYFAGALSLILAVVAAVRSDDLPEYGLIAVAAWLAVSPWVLGLPELVTRQCMMYGVAIAGLAWIARPSYKPRPTST